VRITAALILVAALGTAACSDSLGPQPWDATPDTVTLFSASRVDLLGQPSPFDFINLLPVKPEAPGTAGLWDVMLVTAGSDLQFVPAGAFQGQTSKAAIATITGKTFADLTEAPEDTTLYTTQAVTLHEGAVYVVRTRRDVCSFSTASRFAKIHVITLDPAQGKAKFEAVRNPYCADRSFVPPKE